MLERGAGEELMLKAMAGAGLGAWQYLAKWSVASKHRRRWPKVMRLDGCFPLTPTWIRYQGAKVQSAIEQSNQPSGMCEFTVL